MHAITRTGEYPNLDTPPGNMMYEVERVLTFKDAKMLLTASLLAQSGFFYNLLLNKILCFSCKTEHEPKDFSIKHAPSCNFAKTSISFNLEENSGQNASSFKNSLTVDSVRHPPSPPITTPATATTTFTTTKEIDMKNEADRLKTFTKWNRNVPVEPTDLARNGFYFKGFGDVVMCAYCSLELRNWEQGDDVHTEHKNHSPGCLFLATASEIPDALPTIMNYEQNRLKSFANVSGAFAVCTKALSQNGFYFIGPDIDRVCCSSCKCELSNWERNDNIRQRHQNLSPNCQFVQNNESASVNRYPSNVIFDRPKHIQFALLNDRLKTFVNWPKEKKQTPQLLAEAGFYHTGETDTVICYCCDGGLCNWDEDDDPWIEHARWYPRCTYVRQRKGDQFVSSVNRDELAYSSDANGAGNISNDEVEAIPTASGGRRPILNSDLQVEVKDAIPKITQSIKKSPTVLAVLGLGYDEKIVEYVVKKKLKETGSAFAKASLLLEAVVKYIEEVGPTVPKNQLEEIEQPDKLENQQDDRKQDGKLREENRLLKEQKTCKICLDNDLSIVFLPCGHFVSCATCAPSLKTCPLCRSQVLGLVRAYMS